MDCIGGINEISKVSEINESEKKTISKEILDKFDKLMGDDKIHLKPIEDGEQSHKLNSSEIERKFNGLFDVGDFFKTTESSNRRNIEMTDCEKIYDTVNLESHYSEKREQNSKYEFNENTYETDDNGNIYKKNGELLPDIEYTVNGNIYKTDERGNKISCDAWPEYTENGLRNIKEQREAGGEERQDGDDGGHIIARMLGGAEGDENLVAMRRTINRGDYKKMENEIAKALQEEKQVTVHIDLEYGEDSTRPSKIRAQYIIDGRKTICQFDNVENSTELSEFLYDKISQEDYKNLKAEIEDMKTEGMEASVTSVKMQYDENGEPKRIIVGFLEESTGKKTYKVYEPRQEA